MIRSSFSTNFSILTLISCNCSVILRSIPMMSYLSAFRSTCLVTMANRSSLAVCILSILPPILSRPLLSTRDSRPAICVMTLRMLSEALTEDCLSDSYILFIFIWFCSILSTCVFRLPMTSGEARLLALVTVPCSQWS